MVKKSGDGFTPTGKVYKSTTLPKPTKKKHTDLGLKDDDLLLISADHGNDPNFKGSDHTREKVFLLGYSKRIKKSKKLDEQKTFATIGATIINNFNLVKPSHLIGESILKEINGDD